MRAVAVLSLVSLLILLMNCSTQENNTPSGVEARPVDVVPVEESTFRETIDGIGTALAAKHVEIKPELDGIIQTINCTEGQPVRKGHLLFVIDDDKLMREREARTEELKAARARLKNAERIFKRKTKLFRQQVISEDEWDEAETNLDTMQADVNRIEAEIALIDEQLKDTMIRAPFAGVLSEILVDPGDYVAKGDTLVTLYNLDSIEFASRIPDRYMERVKNGQEAEIRIGAYPDFRFYGEVTFVSPVVDEFTRDFLVKVTISTHQHPLKPGAFGKMTIILGEQERASIPEEALVLDMSGYSVFVVEDRTARQRSVRPGRRRPGIVEIREGVGPGDMVIRSGHMRLSEGDRVTIRTTTTIHERERS